MSKVLLVGFGGFLGAILRYGLASCVQARTTGSSIPWATLAVNVLGCLIIGLVSKVAEMRGVISTETHSFLVIGLLGSLTTFSTFSSETMTLFGAEENHFALLNVALQLTTGLGAVRLGQIIALWLLV